MPNHRPAWRVLSTAAVAVSTLTALTACGGSEPATQASATAVTIGVAMPGSGPSAPTGAPIIKAIQLAVKEANAAGGLPATIQVDVQDDQDKPELAASLARKFCGDDSVIAAVADYSSSVTLASQPVYNRCGMAQLVPTSSNDALTTKGYTNFFRNTAKNSDAVVGALDWVTANQPDVKSMVTIDDNSASMADIAAQLKDEAAKHNITLQPGVKVAAGQTDFRGALTGVIANKPDMIYLATFFNEGALLTKQARELGYTGPIFGSDGNDSPDFVKIAGKASDGFTFAGLGVDPAKTPAAKPFVDAYQAEYKEAPNSAAAQAYDTTRVVIAAWKQAGGGTDRAALIEAIRGTKLDGTGGPIAYDENGDMTEPQVGIFRIEEGKSTFLEAAS